MVFLKGKTFEGVEKDSSFKSFKINIIANEFSSEDPVKLETHFLVTLRKSLLSMKEFIQGG